MAFRRLVVSVSLLVIGTTFGYAAEPSGTQVHNLVQLYRTQNEIEILRELAALVTLPNIATNLDHMERNAEHLTGLLESRRFEVELLRAEGAPPVGTDNA